MKTPFKKLDFTSLVALVIFAISLSIMNFEDLSWEVNKNSYLGFIAFFVLLMKKIFMPGENKNE